MKERPILFSGAMVRAILDGRKTQTRRIVKHLGAVPPDWATFAENLSQPKYDLSAWVPSGLFMWSEEQTPGQPLKPLRRWPCEGEDSPLPGPYGIRCPYGKPGDRFWVREAWRVGKPHDQTPPRDILPSALQNDKGVTVLYEAGGWRSIGPAGREEPVYANDAPMPVWAGKLRPSMFMPRGMSRITLEITSVRVERLNDCSEADAEAEGIAFLRDVPDVDETLTARQLYECLWDSINGASAWAANPWVWVIEFRRTA